MIAGRFGLDTTAALVDFLGAGFSFGAGRYDDDGRRRIRMFGLDFLVREGPFELLGEYAWFDLERGAAEVAAGVPGGADGFYVQLNAHFFPDCWRGATPFFTNESTFTFVFRYDSVDTDDSARAIDRVTRGDAFRDDTRRFTFGINFRPVEKTVIKAEYQWFDERDGIPGADNDRIVFSIASYF